MYISGLLQGLAARAGGCDLSNCPDVQCPGSCNLEIELCNRIAPACPSTCAVIRCDKKPQSSSGGGATSPGTLAGAVIGALIFLALVVIGYMYYRRREAAKEAAARDQANVDVKPDIPARADAVLSRPDPHLAARASSLNSAEKGQSRNPSEVGQVRTYGQSASTINLDPAQPLQSSSASSRSNPFTDKLSIQTASERSQSTNVIPIALVAPSGPSRPPRDPGLTLDREHTEEDLLGEPLEDIRLPYASSTRSGVSGRTFMTTSSIATDLDEPPQIVNPTQGVVRQVLSVAPAQVVRVPSNGSNLKAPRNARAAALVRNASKGTVGRSPLAQQSFTPADIPLANRELSSPTSTRTNPFSDAASPNHRESFADSARSTDTFGTPQYHSEGPFTPRPGATFADMRDDRPISVASTADGFSIRADISTASRVILGMQSAPATAVSPGFGHLASPGFQSRATSMQTNSSSRTAHSGDHDDSDGFRPYSMAMSSKTSSSRADSVLAAFPFVPPSPISALPPRSPGNSTPGPSPASSGSTFAKQQALSTPLPNSPPLSPRSTTTTQGSMTPRTMADHQSMQPHSLANGRTVSTFSSASGSGLDKYPFQFSDEEPLPTPVMPTNRASLDTLKITRDLAAFPLELDSFPDSGNTRR